MSQFYLKERFMRTLTPVLCALCIAWAQQPRTWRDALPNSWGAGSEGWQLALLSEKQSYFSDEPSWVMLVARNGNSQRLRVSINKSQWKAADFTIKSVGSNPRTINPRPGDLLDKMRRDARGTTFFQAEPGSIIHPGLVNLREIFDLSPGTYTVMATCNLPRPSPGLGVVGVSSNQIMISIIAR